MMLHETGGVNDIHFWNNLDNKYHHLEEYLMYK